MDYGSWIMAIQAKCPRCETKYPAGENHSCRKNVKERQKAKSDLEIFGTGIVHEGRDGSVKHVPLDSKIAEEVFQSTTYEYRDPEKRREYMREYQKERRRKKAAERNAKN